MPELRALLSAPPQGGPAQLPTEGDSNWLDSFLAGVLGDQLPGDAASAVGAMSPLLPISKLLKLLGAKAPRGVSAIGPASSEGDRMLREHVFDSHKLREFLPVGGEGKHMIPSASGKGFMSPPGSGPHSVDKHGVDWPKPEDLDELRLRVKMKKPRGE
jgi:hypothetical protein